MLEFADEVVVFDTSDGSDNTLEELRKLETKSNNRVVVTHVDNFGWDSPNFGVLDGQAKACSRSLCEGDALWQFDLDEVVHEDHVHLIKPLAQNLLDCKAVNLIALPVVEYWGRKGDVRIDINLQKWRLSKNLPDITHGVPAPLRKIENGLLYAKHGTDGCDYISRTTNQVIPCSAVIDPQFIRSANYQSQVGNDVSLVRIKGMFNEMLGTNPGVFHYSWFNIERKIKQYKKFWTGFWPSLYNEQRDERSNPFFSGLMWSEVSDKMIADKARELEQGCCGHIFHTPWNGQPSYGIIVNKQHPKVMKNYVNLSVS
jgi:hypothetical protein